MILLFSESDSGVKVIGLNFSTIDRETDFGIGNNSDSLTLMVQYQTLGFETLMILYLCWDSINLWNCKNSWFSNVDETVSNSGFGETLDSQKELSLCNKIKYLNPNIFRTLCCKPLIFHTQINWFNRIHSLKYLRSRTFGSKDIVIRISEFVAKTQFLY